MPTWSLYLPKHVVGRHLFLVVEALVVVLEGGIALLRSGCVLGGRIDNVACQNLLPEGKAASGTCNIGGDGDLLAVPG